MQVTLKRTARNKKSKHKKRLSESVQEASNGNGGRNKTILPADFAVLGDTEHSKPENRSDPQRGRCNVSLEDRCYPVPRAAPAATEESQHV